MRITTIVRTTETKASTTVYASLDYRPPLRPCYVNSEYLASSGLASFDAIGLVISTEELGECDVVLALPPLPFSDLTANTVRYEHKIVRGGKERGAPTTLAQPVTRAYIEKWALPDGFIAEKKPIFLGLFAVVSGAKRIKSAAAVEEVARLEALAGFDGFLGDVVREEEGGKLTTRRVWRVWAERWGADPDECVIGVVAFGDVAGRISEILKVAAEKYPTRVDGRSQRYWEGYAI